MLIKYDEVETEASILNAIFGAYITSPYDPRLFAESLEGDDVLEYQDMRTEFHKDNRLSLQNGVRLPILAPGEGINTVNAARQ
jgi:capsid protein